jgi:hypothetical protein
MINKSLYIELATKGDVVNLLYNIHLDFRKNSKVSTNEFMFLIQQLQIYFTLKGLDFQSEMLQFIKFTYEEKLGVHRMYDKDGSLIKIY